MIDQKSFNCERQKLFMRTRGLVYLPLIGIIFWPSAGVAGFYLPPQVWSLYILITLSIGLTMSAVVLFFKRRQIEKLSPIASLFVPALSPLALSFIITVAYSLYDPYLTPLLLVLGLSTHWPVIGWIFNQTLYAFHTAIRLVIALLAWFIYPDFIFTYLPITIGLLYFLTSIRIFHSLKHIKQSQLFKRCTK